MSKAAWQGGAATRRALAKITNRKSSASAFVCHTWFIRLSKIHTMLQSFGFLIGGRTAEQPELSEGTAASTPPRMEARARTPLSRMRALSSATPQQSTRATPGERASSPASKYAVSGQNAAEAAAAAGQQCLPVGTTLEVYWTGSDEYYKCKVIGHRAHPAPDAATPGQFMHRCEYDDGIVEHDLSTTDYEVIQRGDPRSLEAAAVGVGRRWLESAEVTAEETAGEGYSQNYDKEEEASRMKVEANAALNAALLALEVADDEENRMPQNRLPQNALTQAAAAKKLPAGRGKGGEAAVDLKVQSKPLRAGKLKRILSFGRRPGAKSQPAQVMT